MEGAPQVAVEGSGSSGLDEICSQEYPAAACERCYDFFLLWTIMISLLLIAPIWLLLTYSSWLITYDILSQIDLVCVPDPLVYKPSVQTVFFSFDLGK